MDKHPIGELMETTMQKIKEMVDVNTIVGAPIRTGEDITIIPVSKVSFGFGAGGGDFVPKNQSATGDNPFGGGSGAGVNISPVAFLVVNGDAVRLIPVSQPNAGPMDRVVEMVPDVVDKVTEFINKRKEKAEDNPDQ